MSPECAGWIDSTTLSHLTAPTLPSSGLRPHTHASHLPSEAKTSHGKKTLTSKTPTKSSTCETQKTLTSKMPTKSSRDTSRRARRRRSRGQSRGREARRRGRHHRSAKHRGVLYTSEAHLSEQSRKMIDPHVSQQNRKILDSSTGLRAEPKDT